MRSGPKLATALAVMLTVCSGIAAVGATTGLLADPPAPPSGTVHLVDRTTPGRRPSVSTPPASNAGAKPSSRNAVAPTRPSAATDSAAAPTPGAAGVDPNPRSEPATTNAKDEPGAPASGTAEEPELGPAPPEATTPTEPIVVPPPSTNCHGSDDGMSEAEKQARERACGGSHDDD